MFGTGIGSHREIYPTYLKEIPKFHKQFTHAENGYLQLCLEAGSIGLGLALVGFLIAIIWCVSGMRKAESSEVSLIFAAGLASILANLAHSGSDFIWYCPACVVIVIILAACVCRTRHMIRDINVLNIGWRMPKIAWIVAILGVGVLSHWMVNEKIPRVGAEVSYFAFLNLEPDEEQTVKQVLADRMKAFSASVKSDPRNAQMQLLLGLSYIDLFKVLQSESENPISLSQFRETALASNFESKEALYEWLDRAVEGRVGILEKALYHNRQALRLCPLKGQAYLSLSELAFLDMADEAARDDYIAQALAVRPYDPHVLLKAGDEAIAAGRNDEAFQYWGQAFHRNDAIRDKIIQRLAPSATAEFMLEKFEPDEDALPIIAGYYRGLGLIRSRDLTVILNAYAERSIELATAGDLSAQKTIEHWMTAQRCYAELGNQVKVRSCLESAIAVDPGDYNPRLAYGHWLFSIKRYKEAAGHLIFCAKRRPGDVKITTLAKYVKKKSLQQTKSAAFEGPDFEFEDESDEGSQPTQIAVEPSQATRF